MTRKRFKKLLMGRYKFSRNQAENISRAGNYTIEEREDTTIIGGYIAILKPGHWKIKNREEYAELLWNSFAKLVADGIDRMEDVKNDNKKM